MNLLKMPCAGKLGNCPKTLNRFHWSCLRCRWRWDFLGKWTNPPFWITYARVWRYARSCTKTRIMVVNLLIDPRGHLVNLRCAVIVALMKLAEHFPILLPSNTCFCFTCRPDREHIHLVRVRKYFVTVCEFFATITI